MEKGETATSYRETKSEGSLFRLSRCLVSIVISFFCFFFYLLFFFSSSSSFSFCLFSSHALAFFFYLFLSHLIRLGRIDYHGDSVSWFHSLQFSSFSTHRRCLLIVSYLTTLSCNILVELNPNANDQTRELKFIKNSFLLSKYVI